MNPLPPSNLQVQVPEHVAPSALGVFCVLKILLSSKANGSVPRLLSGPEAVIGTLVHRVLERAAKGDGGTPDQIWDAEYLETTNALRADPRRGHFSELASVKSILAWKSFRRRIIAAVSQIQAEAPARGRTRTAPDSHAGLTGAEVFLKSDVLRLRGKADRIRSRGPGKFEIRDYKTGSVLDDSGHVSAHIAIQLKAYGVMLAERLPDAEIALVVDDGSEREVPFGEDDRNLARHQLEEFAKGLPKQGAADPEQYASPGNDCFYCDARLSCSAYRRAAPGWWREYPDGLSRAPNDVAGQVTKVSLHSGSYELSILDMAGRHVQVRGIDHRHGCLDGIERRTVWFFNLETVGPSRDFRGKSFHPQVYHELAQSGRDRRAWKTELFVVAESADG